MGNIRIETPLGIVIGTSVQRTAHLYEKASEGVEINMKLFFHIVRSTHAARDSRTRCS